VTASVAAPTPRFEVDAMLCFRCGASRSVAPGLIRLGSRAATVVRQPVGDDELALARRAAAICPANAIRDVTA